ncbi:putative reductase [Lyophyllum shimeji]|uniref:Reductase n=1 Tax=Lyophyllum shimeji TaxID=47721 RepID=A0A9P3PRF5_LYOSH|nr:putative reductase [Lyophyllum shimeji]
MPHLTTFPEVANVNPSLITFQTKRNLNDGREIPIMGFGTYELEGTEAYKGVTWALEAGYRLIDSAEWYENEKECGQAIRDFCAAHDVPRADIFYITKLKLNNGYDHAREAIRRSLDACGLGYIDLYLIHGPIGGKQARQDSWRAIVDAQKEGLVKSIGISTFGIKHIEDILELDIGVPAVHQIDIHPFMVRAQIVKWCMDRGMLMQAWAPLARGMRFNHPVVVKTAEKYGKTPGQVLLRWSVQKGYVPIPKSRTKERIIENTDIFDFELGHGELIGLGQLDEQLVTDWDPTGCD